jgi:hypothetical protein
MQTDHGLCFKHGFQEPPTPNSPSTSGTAISRLVLFLGNTQHLGKILLPGAGLRPTQLRQMQTAGQKDHEGTIK